VAEPRNADALAYRERRACSGAERFDHGDDLVPRNDWQARYRQFAVDDVQVGAAYGAGFDSGDNFAAPGLQGRPLFEPQRLSGLMQDHRVHECALPETAGTIVALPCAACRAEPATVRWFLSLAPFRVAVFAEPVRVLPASLLKVLLSLRELSP
jgi:hypothetical protein